MVARAGVDLRATRSLWLALIAGPAAWLIDESIGLLVEANACSGPIHRPPTALVHATHALSAVVALVAIALGVLSARRWLRDTEPVDEPTATALDRTRFLAHAALILAALGAFGIVLRLISSLTAPVCG